MSEKELVLFDRTQSAVLCDEGNRRYFLLTLSGYRPPDWKDGRVMFREKRKLVEEAFEDVRDEREVCTRCVLLWTQKIMGDGSVEKDLCEQAVFGIIDMVEGQAVWHVRGGCPRSLNPAGGAFGASRWQISS